MYSNDKKTKIVATVGPACSDKEVLKRMVKAGVNVFRLNFSHAVYDVLREVIVSIREINEEMGTNVAILGDLQGPKIRIGEVQNNGITLKTGDRLKLITEKCIGNKDRIYLNYLEFPLDVEEGDQVLLDDGKIKFEVISTNRLDEVEVVVIHGGLLSSKKGVNLPNTKVSLPSLTEKDLGDLEFILDHDLDWVALSFVREAKDIVELRERITARGKDIHIIAKIEKPQAIDNIDGIIAATDGIMVARGDLGVEYPIEKLPTIQKLLVQKCLKESKPVIIATQMMESMITSFMPTRAEANDVANAVFDGADALMLSGETSVGQHPVQVIEYMVRIIKNVEDEAQHIYHRDNETPQESDDFISDSLCYIATRAAKYINANAIIGMTKSGYTAYQIASYRPKAPVFIFTPDQALLTRISLLWGVRAFFYDKLTTTDETISDVLRMLKEKKLVQKNDVVVNTGVMPIKSKNRANFMKFSVVE
ncbi:MAG: pyruvate kinase [Sphingobacteriaceae bacterium]|nr:pyruvate kinase [Sphingobacteriaceae bacterium]